MEHLGNYLTRTDVLSIKIWDVVHWQEELRNLFLCLQKCV